jgi:hypothetical protein
VLNDSISTNRFYIPPRAIQRNDRERRREDNCTRLFCGQVASLDLLNQTLILSMSAPGAEDKHGAYMDLRTVRFASTLQIYDPIVNLMKCTSGPKTSDISPQHNAWLRISSHVYPATVLSLGESFDGRCNRKRSLKSSIGTLTLHPGLQIHLPRPSYRMRSSCSLTKKARCRPQTPLLSIIGQILRSTCVLGTFPCEFGTRHPVDRSWPT